MFLDRRAGGRRLRRRLPRRAPRAGTSGCASGARPAGQLVVAVGFALLALRLGRRVDRPLVHADHRPRPRHVGCGSCCAVVVVYGTVERGEHHRRPGRPRRRARRRSSSPRSSSSASGSSATRTSTAIDPAAGDRPRGRRRRVRGCVRRLPLVERGAGADLHGRHRLARARRRDGRARAARRNVCCCCRSSAGSTSSRRCSVIAQVISFRGFGRRVLRMAPIHHHFEVGGWPEFTVIVRFWIFAGVVRRARARPLLRRLHQHPRGASTDAAVLVDRARRSPARPWCVTAAVAGRRRDRRRGPSGRERTTGPPASAQARDARAPRSSRRRDRSTLDALGAAAPTSWCRAPGVPERHPAIAGAAPSGVPVRSEIDLAAERRRARRRDRRGHRHERQDDRHDAHRRDARRRRACAPIAAGNIGRPLLDAVARRRRRRGRRGVVVPARRSPQRVRAHGPRCSSTSREDHLDWHRTFDAYAAGKGARLRAPGPRRPARVQRRRPGGRRARGGRTGARRVPFSVAAVRPTALGVVDTVRGRSSSPGRQELAPVDGSAARATARPRQRARGERARARRGRDARCGPRGAARRSHGLPHRVELVAEHGGVRCDRRLEGDQRARDACARSRGFDARRARSPAVATRASTSRELRVARDHGSARWSRSVTRRPRWRTRSRAPSTVVSRRARCAAAVRGGAELAAAGRHVLLLARRARRSTGTRPTRQRGDDFAAEVRRARRRSQR